MTVADSLFCRAGGTD